MSWHLRAELRRGLLPLAAATALVVALVGVGGVAGTHAFWTDNAVATSGQVRAATLSSPGLATTPCTAENGLFDGQITLRWNGADPTTTPALDAYEYELRFINRDTGQQVGAVQTHVHSGAPGSVHSVSYSGTLLGNLLGLNLLNSTRLQLQVRTHLVGSTWYGPTRVLINFSTASVLGFVNFACGTAGTDAAAQ